MPYIPVVLGFLLFTVAGCAATLYCVFSTRHKRFLSSVWRAWLGGTIGFIVANVILGAIFAFFIYGGGVVGGAAQSRSVRDAIILILVILGPLLASAAGVAGGIYIGLKSANRSHVNQQ